MKYPAWILPFLLFVGLFVFGCDFSGDAPQPSPKTFSPEEMAAKHNEAVSQTLDELRSRKKSTEDQFHLDRQTVEEAITETQVHSELNRRAETDLENGMAAFRRHLREERNLSKAATEEIEVADLHRANMLSDTQMAYIDSIRSMNDVEAVRHLAATASQKLGDAGIIVEIYAETYSASLSYWKAHADEVRRLAGTPVVKDSIDWRAAAAADAAGVVVGAVGYAWYAVVNGSATAGLTFGPQGAVITITGAAITGAVTVGAGSSVEEALEQWAYSSMSA